MNLFMLSQDVSNELQTILERLRDEGKEPTVALVKARLSVKVPMPALITTIKRWKSTSQVPKIEVALKEPDNNERIKELEKTIQNLVKRIEYLELHLGKQQLKHFNKKGLIKIKPFIFCIEFTSQ